MQNKCKVHMFVFRVNKLFDLKLYGGVSTNESHAFLETKPSWKAIP